VTGVGRSFPGAARPKRINTRESDNAILMKGFDTFWGREGRTLAPAAGQQQWALQVLSWEARTGTSLHYMNDTTGGARRDRVYGRD